MQLLLLLGQVLRRECLRSRRFAQLRFSEVAGHDRVLVFDLVLGVGDARPALGVELLRFFQLGRLLVAVAEIAGLVRLVGRGVGVGLDEPERVALLFLRRHRGQLEIEGLAGVGPVDADAGVDARKLVEIEPRRQDHEEQVEQQRTPDPDEDGPVHRVLFGGQAARAGLC